MRESPRVVAHLGFARTPIMSGMTVADAAKVAADLATLVGKLANATIVDDEVGMCTITIHHCDTCACCDMGRDHIYA